MSRQLHPTQTPLPKLKNVATSLSAAPGTQQEFLEDEMLNLPFGMLRKAQHALTYAKAVSDAEDSASSLEDTSEDEDVGEPVEPKGKEKEKPEWHPKPRKDLAKRPNKHAPQEVTSKRPVTRKRQVVDVKVQHPRDPRFLSVTGEFSRHKFQEQYDFLSDIHLSELKTLRENLKRARKLLLSSPRDLREERQQEVSKLELALKRAESSVNKDRQEMVEKKVLSQVSKEEREKQKKGKGKWWMKQSDKKNLLLRARYDDLAATGGKAAINKAIEKKQKKMSQKEKKSRPFVQERRSEGAQGSNFSKRSSNSQSAMDEGRFQKRRRVE